MTPKLKTKPSGIHFWEFEGEQGERRRVSTGTRDKAAARAMGRDIVLGLNSKHRPGRSGVLRPGEFTMRDLFEQAERTVWADGAVKSKATIHSTIGILVDLIGNVPVVEMTTIRVQGLKTELERRPGRGGRPYAPGTVKRKLDVLSTALRLATEWGPSGVPLLSSTPRMPSIRLHNIRDRILESDEEAAVFSAIEQRRLAEPGRQWWRFGRLVRWLLDTGFRVGEALSLGPASVRQVTVIEPTSRRPKTVWIAELARYSTKTDKPRAVPVTDRCVADLPMLETQTGLRPRGDGAVFFPMEPGLAWYMWDQIRQDLAKEGVDISDVTLHTLRHTCLTRLARGGMDILRLQKWAGHSDISITAARYAHLIPADLVGGLDILERASPQSIPEVLAEVP